FPGGGGFGLTQFSLDGKWFAFSYTPYTKAGSTPPAAARPKAKVVLVNLGTGERTEIEGAASFRFAGEAPTHIAFRKISDGSAAPSGPVGPPAPGASTPTPATGSDLVLRE